MGRTPNTLTVVPPRADAPELAELSAAQAEMDARYRQIAEQWGDGLPYQADRIAAEVRFYIAQGAEAMLEAGKRLIVLREREPRGEWIDLCEQRIGISPRTAQQMMQAAVKFVHATPGNARAPAHLVRLGKAKLLELLAEDNDEIAGLADGGTVAGLTLDDIDRMTSRELRAALREARQTSAAKDRVLCDKSAELDKRSTELARIKAEKAQQSLLIQVAVADPDEQRAQLLGELLRRVARIEVDILGDLHLALSAVREHAQTTGIPADDAIAGALGQIRRALAEMEFTYQVKSAPDGALMPEASIWDAVGVEFDRERAAAAPLEGEILAREDAHE